MITAHRISSSYYRYKFRDRSAVIARFGAHLILCVILCSTNRESAANPWTKDRGDVYLNLNTSLLTATKWYGPDFKRVPIGNHYTQHTLSVYSEIGLIDRWLTGVIDWNLFRFSELSGRGKTYGLGDMRIALFSGLLLSPINLAVGSILGIPTGEVTPRVVLNGSTLNQKAASLLPTGDGEWDAELRVDVGKGWRWQHASPSDHYLRAEMGYWLRSRGFADAINWNVEIGSKFNTSHMQRFWFIVRFFGSESFAGSDRAPSGPAGLGNGITHRSFGLTIAMRVWRALTVSIAADGSFTARSLPATPNLLLSLSYDFRRTQRP